MNDSSYIAVAQLAAQKAGDYLRENFGKTICSATKESQHSVVTAHDLESERIIIELLQLYFPSHSILSEEMGLKDRKTSYLWVIDPLDGSSYYARGIPTYSVSISLLKNMEIICGVVYCPANNEMFYAEKGGGAFLNKSSISVSPINKLNESIFSAGHRYLRLEIYETEMRKLLKAVRSIRAGGSCAQELCNVAVGRIDALLTVNQSFWDYAAGALILEEAGGTITDIVGVKLNIDKYMLKKFDLLATNTILHTACTQ